MGKWKNPLDMALHKNFSHPMMDPNNDKNILCHECKESFSGMEVLKRHIKSVHFDVKLPQCDICLKYFATKGQLNSHWKYSACKSEPIPCDHCNETFKTKRYLHEHGIRAHGNLVLHSKMRIPCEICGSSMRQHNMKKHMSEVHSDQTLICDQCSKEFKAEKYLKIHKERAHLSKTIKCIVEGCNFLFGSQSLMNLSLIHI